MSSPRSIYIVSELVINRITSLKQTHSANCHAHSLNLASGDWIRNAAVVSKSYDTSYEITKLVMFSIRRDSHHRKIHAANL